MHSFQVAARDLASLKVKEMEVRVAKVRLARDKGDASPRYFNVAKGDADTAATQFARARQTLQATEDLLRQSQPTFPEVVQELARYSAVFALMQQNCG